MTPKPKKHWITTKQGKGICPADGHDWHWKTTTHKRCLDCKREDKLVAKKWWK